MNDLTRFVSITSNDGSHASAVDGASHCLDRFTARFNACDAAAVDAELDFPHLMISGASRLVWNDAGQHPPGFFNELKALGWARTEYVSKQVVLASVDKVHFLIDYVRKDMAGPIISTHRNIWIVVLCTKHWRITVRSY